MGGWFYPLMTWYVIGCFVWFLWCVFSLVSERDSWVPDRAAERRYARMVLATPFWPLAVLWWLCVSAVFLVRTAFSDVS